MKKHLRKVKKEGNLKFPSYEDIHYRNNQR